uniref:Uncharacterized protein n=1 Tax=Aegilops tauschii subsp. strangulata TaxID=200361 RepID=A0A453R5V9_AEGTS
MNQLVLGKVHIIDVNAKIDISKYQVWCGRKRAQMLIACLGKDWVDCRSIIPLIMMRDTLKREKTSEEILVFRQGVGRWMAA